MNLSDMPLSVCPINRVYHDGEGGFREQMAVLRPGAIWADEILMIRDFVTVCTPGMAGFDSEQPGLDTAAGWKRLDTLIENEGVRGLFHTHPPGAGDFSSKDREAQIALARTYGSRLLWHGIQPVTTKDTARFICMRMVGASMVIVYDFGWITTNINDRVIALPMPPELRDVGNNVFTMSMVDD